MIARESRSATLDLQRAREAIDIRAIECGRARVSNSSVKFESSQWKTAASKPFRMARNRPRVKLVETVIQGIAQAHVWDGASRGAPRRSREEADEYECARRLRFNTAYCETRMLCEG